MSAARTNVHGTAIVVGKTGLLFTGPSGCGKSMLAFHCLANARALNLPAMLIADDRVFVSGQEPVVAECPPAIAGLMEIRFTGIVRLPHVAAAEIHWAVRPVDPASAERLPPDDERIDVAGAISLPLIRISALAANPLAIIMAKTGISFSQSAF
jgi:serine kinase of HPr protein (carbohydrate metabolism regulator)